MTRLIDTAACECYNDDTLCDERAAYLVYLWWNDTWIKACGKHATKLANTVGCSVRPL